MILIHIESFEIQFDIVLTIVLRVQYNTDFVSSLSVSSWPDVMEMKADWLIPGQLSSSTQEAEVYLVVCLNWVIDSSAPLPPRFLPPNVEHFLLVPAGASALFTFLPHWGSISVETLHSTGTMWPCKSDRAMLSVCGKLHLKTGYSIKTWRTVWGQLTTSASFLLLASY